MTQVKFTSVFIKITGFLLLIIIFTFKGFAATKENASSIRTLNKMTGKVEDFILKKNEELVIGTLKITLHECYQSTPIEEPESVALVSVYANKSEDIIFYQWIFASSPAYHSLDHAIYDFWLLSCVSDKTNNN